MVFAVHGFRALSALGLVFAVAFSPAAAAAGDSADLPAATEWVETEQTRLRLVSAQKGVPDSGVVAIGLQVELDPGWKIYWRSPGDSGFPPQFDWAASKNLDRVEVLWPAPKRLLSGGVETLGYKNEVVYPIRAWIDKKGQGATIKLKLDYGICKDICVPYSAELELTVPANGEGQTVFAPLIERFLAKVPTKGPDRAKTGLTVTGAYVEPGPGKQILVVTASSTQPLHRPDVIVEADPGPEGFSPFYFELLESQVEADKRKARFRYAVSSGKRKLSLAGVGLTFTLMDAERAVEQRMRVTGD